MENASLKYERAAVYRDRDLHRLQSEHVRDQARLLQESNARYEARVEQLEALVRACTNQTSTLRTQLAKVAATNAMLEDAAISHGWEAATRGAGSDPDGGGSGGAGGGGGGVYPGKEGSTHAGGAFCAGLSGGGASSVGAARRAAALAW